LSITFFIEFSPGLQEKNRKSLVHAFCGRKKIFLPIAFFAGPVYTDIVRRVGACALVRGLAFTGIHRLS
jgi:hypothetical protein